MLFVKTSELKAVLEPYIKAEKERKGLELFNSEIWTIHDRLTEHKVHPRQLWAIMSGAHTLTTLALADRILAAIDRVEALQNGEIGVFDWPTGRKYEDPESID